MHSKLLATCAAAAVTACLAPVAAFAQAAPADPSATQLPEVIVQARRVSEDQQKTPVAVTAISKDVLRLDTTTEVTEIQKDVPSFEIAPNTFGGDAAPSFTIRGLSTSLLADPSVVSYVDGVVQDPRNFAYMFYDMDSVQVLKGPQGTLFGKNSTGGALLLQPVHPGTDFGGWIDARFGNYNDREFTGAINLPVNDQLQFRISGEWEQRDGTVDSVNSNLQYDNRNHGSLRAEMAWKPTEWFDNYLSATTYRVRQINNSPIVTGLNTNCPPPSPGGFPQGLGECYFEFPTTLGLGTVDIGQEFAQQQTLGRDKTVNATPTPFDVDFDGITDIAQFHLGSGITIRNIAHGDWSSYNIATDFDGTNAPIVGQDDNQNSHFYSEELQALGKAGNLNWIVGAYYSDTRVNDSQVLNQLDFPGNPLGLVLVHDIEPSSSSAVFGQATYDFSDWVKGLTLTAGYRYTWDRKSFTDQRLAPAAAAPPMLGGFGTDCALIIFGIPADPTTCTRSDSAHWSNSNYNVSLNWQATPDLLLYIATRKGYKAGGFNFASSTAALVSYAPEEYKDVEVGLKGDWHLGPVPVRTNLAVYRGDYTNIQSDFEDFSGPIPQLLILNTDPFTGQSNKATMQGVEAEVTVVPMSGVTITGYYGYAQGKYDRFDAIGFNNLGMPVPVNLDGQWIAGITPTTEGLTFTWSPDLSDHWGKPVFGAFLYHQSKQSTNVASGATLGESAFTNLDLRLDWRHIWGGPVDLAIYGKNVTNDRHLIEGEDLTGLANIQSAEYAEPRMFGVELRYHFGAGN